MHGRFVRRLWLCLACLAALFLSPSLARHASAESFNILSDAGDGALQHIPSQGQFDAFPDVDTTRVGKGGAFPNRGNVNAVYFFELPDFSGDSLMDAELRFPYIDGENSFSVSDLDVWGLGYVASPTLDASWLYVGDNDVASGVNITTRQRIQDDVVGAIPDPNDIPVLVSTSDAGNANLLSFIQSLYTQGAQPGDYAVIRLNDDRANPDPNDSGTGGYRVGFSEFAGPVPQLGLFDATVIDWANPSGGDYATAGNWSPNEVPDNAPTAETARFDLDATYSVTFAGESTNSATDLIVSRGNVAFAPAASATANAIYNLSGQAIVEGGTLFLPTSSTQVGVDVNVAGELMINDAGTLLVSNGSVSAGGSLTMSAASVLIVDGGALIADTGLDNSAGGTLNHLSGTLTVTGGQFHPNSGGPTDDYVINSFDDDANAHVVIGAGGSANLGSDLYIGRTVGSEHGMQHNGELTISGGGQVSNASAELGNSVSPLDSNNADFGFGAVTVEGQSSSWTNSGDMWIKRGDLTIQDGAAVTNANARLGFASRAFAIPNAVLHQTVGAVVVSGTDAMGNPSTWTNNGTLRIGFGGFGELSVHGGGVVTGDSAIVGDTNGVAFGSGQVTVDGVGSLWSTSGNITFNSTVQSGYSRLIITSGGTVSSAAATVNRGIITVDGANGASTWTNTSSLAIIGSSVLTVRDGGVVEGLNGSVLDGQVTVTGDDGSGNASTWTNSGNLQIDGTLFVSSGGNVSNTSAYVATDALTNATVALDGPGTVWTHSVDLYVSGDDVASGGTAAITIQNQALIEVVGMLKVWDRGVIDILSGGVVDIGGMLEVSDIGRLTLRGGTLKVDSTQVVSTGAIDYQSGGLHLTDPGGYTAGANSGPIELVLGGDQIDLLEDKFLIVEETLSFPVGSSLLARDTSVSAGDLINDGRLNLTNTTIATTTGLSNQADLLLIDSTVDGPVNNSAGAAVTILGSADFNGPVTGPGSFFGPGTANFNGGLSIGASPAEVSFEGNVALAAANDLTIELGGLLAGSEFDRLVIGGSVDLDGVLAVELIGDFVPTAGNTFEIISAADVSGTFAVESLPELSGLEWDISYGATNVVLSVVSAGLPGDYNNDGTVDAADYTVWRDNVGAPAGTLANDPNPGAIGQAQYDTWRSSFGATSATGSLVDTTVPEPGAVLLLGLGAVLIGVGRQRLG